MDVLGIFRGQRDAMFGNGDPTQVPVPHTLKFADHLQEFFAIIRVFLGQMDFTFPVVSQPFAAYFPTV